jgi:hypothetical protein
MKLIDKIRLESLQTKNVKIQVRIPQAQYDLLDEMCQRDSNLDISKCARYFIAKGMIMEGAITYDDYN